MDQGRVIRRHELSDAEWDLVQPLLPRPALGRARLDDRTVLNGIVWKFRWPRGWWSAGKQSAARQDSLCSPRTTTRGISGQDDGAP
ncbi:transposase [Streptomyces sp. NPDC051211]|uniref:transposase n=1 Tax=Streptomyces sp. NPDC051211 TaxID=3154643 RepID=UPI00344CD82D